MSPDEIHAVTVGGDPEGVSDVREAWSRIAPDIELELVESPYREFVKPALDYVRSLEPGPDHTVSVVIPEFVVEHWWENLLHNQSALRLKGALFLVPWVVVVDKHPSPPAGGAGTGGGRLIASSGPSLDEPSGAA